MNRPVPPPCCRRCLLHRRAGAALSIMWARDGPQHSIVAGLTTHCCPLGPCSPVGGEPLRAQQQSLPLLLSMCKITLPCRTLWGADLARQLLATSSRRCKVGPARRALVQAQLWGVQACIPLQGYLHSRRGLCIWGHGWQPRLVLCRALGGQVLQLKRLWRLALAPWVLLRQPRQGLLCQGRAPLPSRDMQWTPTPLAACSRTAAC